MNVLAVNTILYTDRFDDCVAFFADLPGFEISVRHSWFVEFSVGGAFISVANAARTRIAPGGPEGLTLTFRVDDADAVYESLTQRGVTATVPADHPWGARTFYVFDPDGRRVEFWTPAHE